MNGSGSHKALVDSNQGVSKKSQVQLYSNSAPPHSKAVKSQIRLLFAKRALRRELVTINTISDLSIVSFKLLIFPIYRLNTLGTYLMTTFKEGSVESRSRKAEKDFEGGSLKFLVTPEIRAPGDGF